jgi:amino acid adenylation domain-containing protein
MVDFKISKSKGFERMQFDPYVEKKSLVNHKVRNTKKNFVQLFREQVASNPNDTAIVAEGDCLTYQELDQKSDRLAHHLKTIGIKTGSLVGLCASLNSNFIVCMLGIIKAGAAYFPLDPAYPQDRLQHMIQEGNPSAILMEPQFAHLFNDNKIIKIDVQSLNFNWNAEIAKEGDLLQSDDLAYVIYTSGSTGAPKGIMITHKSLPNIALAHKSYYPTNIKMLVSGGVCFDASLLVILHALINKSPLCLFNYNPKDTADRLLKFININSIGFIISIPSQYLKLLEMNCKLPSLQCVSLTGENMPSSLCELHARLAPNATLYNEYGPTECAIGATIAKIYDPKDRSIRKINVGHPLPNTQVYILDHQLNRVPRRAKGEICIGGIGLAKGYLDNEALTTDKFVWLTFPGRKPIRLYRTGDFGRFLPNGELEFLGRVDQRIQMGGNWIDLGEIEYHISSYPDVKESIIMVQCNAQGRKELVAYITSSKAISIKHSLLEYLENLLPRYMIPSYVLQIDKFSFTQNGKIDRDALELVHE